jgi:hypothetical protein
MKYSNYIGVIAAIALIICCFLPWIYIESINATITGLSAEHTNFGKPGILHIFFSTLSVALFLIPAIWAKRTNLFVGSFNFAWAIRNFLMLTHCELGECPHKFFWIYFLVLCSILLLIMTMLPKVQLKAE